MAEEVVRGMTPSQLVSASYDETTGGVSVSRCRHASEGTRWRSVFVERAFEDDGHTPTGELRRTARDMADHLRRLQMRDTAVKEGGVTVANPPPWAFMAHPMAIALMKRADLDPALLCDRAYEATDGLDADGHLTRATDWTSHGLGRRRVAKVDGCDVVFRMEAWADGFVYSDQSRSVFVKLDERIPLTVMNALIGRPVGALLGGRFFADLDVRIVGCDVNDDGTRYVMLDPERVPLAPAPPGTDTGWLTSARTKDGVHCD